MSDKLSAATTYTCGYYNGKKWPVQLVISKLGVTLNLAPGEYVLDGNRRRINDPFFDNYPQLSREVSDTPVPLLIVPELTEGTVNAHAASRSPVQATSKFGIDANGMRQPIMPQPAQAAKALAVANTPPGANPVVPMSIEEARRKGLVRRAREVPEDYGITDTTGAPPRTPPGIKFAIDSSMLKPAPPLPPELGVVESQGVSNPALRASMITQLRTNAKAEAVPATATALASQASRQVFHNQTTVHAPPNSPVTAGPYMPKSVLRPAAPMASEPELEPEMTDEEAAAAEAGTPELPPPDLSELQESEAAPASEVEVAAAAPAAPELKPSAKHDRYVCAGCGMPFKFRSQLDKHAAAKHKAAYAAIMAAYPVE